MRPAFTLLELILVLAIIGLAAGVVSAQLGRMRTTQVADQAARQVLEQSWRCRQLARSALLPVRLRIDAAQRSATVRLLAASGEQEPADAQAAQFDLGDGVDALSAAFTRDDGQGVTTGPIDLLFRADGRCDPAGLLVLSCAGRQAGVRYPAGLHAAQPEAVIPP